MKSVKLRSTLSGEEFPFDFIEEFTEDGESLEVVIPGIAAAKIKPGGFLWERFADFFPFSSVDSEVSLGEGNTPLLKAGKLLSSHTGIENLLLKNETANPTWSFKDRGSLFCVWMAKAMNEKVTATISTGNMGNSLSAYGARAGLNVLVFVPTFTPNEKILAMNVHGATVLKVDAPDYSLMKNRILGLAKEFSLRIVSGNGPIRAEGYKLTAFEMFEQMNKRVPDFIAVPTSACGHIRGIFKGYRELYEAGLIERLPKMIVVQAANNSPIVSAIKQGKSHIIPFANFKTIAEAITSGNPAGGDEIVQKARRYGWLAEDVTEEEIIESQQIFARAGFFVEPATATSLMAVKKLRGQGKIGSNQTVVLMLTGSGLKDMDVLRAQSQSTVESSLKTIKADLHRILTSCFNMT
ncbi:MAG: threonine synthase [Desulfobacterales bacterium]